MRRLILAISVLSLPSLADSRPQDPPAKPALVLANARIYPVSGPVIDGGSILIENGKIKAVGKTISVPSDAKVIDLTGRVVIPGLIPPPASFSRRTPDRPAEAPSRTSATRSISLTTRTGKRPWPPA